MIRVRYLFFFIFLLGAIRANAQPERIWDIKGFTVVHIDTAEGEEPTYERVDAPDGYMGVGIRNAAYVAGRIYITERGDTIYDSGTNGMSVRVRGNSSAVLFKKKPYKIKLEKKADLLGGGKSKHYLLIRDENLKSMLGFTCSEILGFEWTPKWKFVKLVMNGEERGVYMMCEQVKRENARIKTDDDGYLFELDAYFWNEEYYLESTLSSSLNYTFKYPEALNPEQKEYMSYLLRNVETSLKESSSSTYIDYESFAKWCLAQDILGNEDWAGTNMFFKIETGGSPRIVMPTLWDHNQILQVKEGFSGIHSRVMFKYLFRNQAFDTIYKNTWYNICETIYDNLQEVLLNFSSSDMKDAFDELVQVDNERYEKSYKKVDEYVWQYREYMQNRKQELMTLIGNPTNIKAIDSHLDIKGGDYYDIYGRRIKLPFKGMYISKGKKFFIH